MPEFQLSPNTHEMKIQTLSVKYTIEFVQVYTIEHRP